MREFKLVKGRAYNLGSPGTKRAVFFRVVDGVAFFMSISIKDEFYLTEMVEDDCGALFPPIECVGFSESYALLSIKNNPQPKQETGWEFILLLVAAIIAGCAVLRFLVPFLLQTFFIYPNL